MKPYNERLPLIDAAIDALKGKWPDERFNELLLVDGIYKQWVSNRRSYDVVGTRDEFNQRKAELQNKPSWTDAPEWANWLAQDADGQWVWYKTKPFVEGNEFDAGERLLGHDYGEVIGSWQDTLEKRAEKEQKEQDMCECGLSQCPRPIKMEQDMNNNWHEKGELPPVGEVVEFLVSPERLGNPEWVKAHILAVSGEWVVFTHSGFKHPFINNDISAFRPLRTETDKLVEQMCDDAIIGRDKDVQLNPVIVAAIERLAEAGYRKIKPMSRDEFVKKATELCSPSVAFKASELYDAGCRFIDQGE